MFRVRALLSCSLLLGLIFFGRAARAQQQFQCVLGTPTNDPAVKQEYFAEKEVVEKALSLFPHQASWKWMIFPDDATWRKFVDRTHMNGMGGDYYGLTDMDSHETFLRGWTLTHPSDERALPMHVIAHELAYPYLNTHDIRKADALSVQWVKQYTSEEPHSAFEY